jgi:hypothetical protein
VIPVARFCVGQHIHYRGIFKDSPYYDGVIVQVRFRLSVREAYRCVKYVVRHNGHHCEIDDNNRSDITVLV